MRKPLRPRCEALEGRVVLTSSALDSSFGTGGLVLGPISAVSAIAEDSAGRLVVVGTMPGTGTSSSTSLIAERYTSAGTLDPTFGTNGSVTIPLPTDFNNAAGGPHNIAFAADGSIIFAAPVNQATSPGQAFPGGNIPVESIAVRLTPAGKLDTSFGSTGVVAVNHRDSVLNAVAVQADGKVVLAGTDATEPLDGGSSVMIARLTARGVLDTTFNQTGMVVGLGTSSLTGTTGAAVHVLGGGQILVAGSAYTPGYSGTKTGFLTELNADGSVDTASGAVGIITEPIRTITDMAVQTDGKILLVGDNSTDSSHPTAAIVRTLSTGVFDRSFVTPSTTPAIGPNLNVAYQSVQLASDGSVYVGGNSSIVAPGGTLLRQVVIDHYLAGGSLDASFGVGGRITFRPVLAAAHSSSDFGASLAITAASKLVIGGTATPYLVNPTQGNSFSFVATQGVLAQFVPVKLVPLTAGDYNGDGKADLAVELAALGQFAIRKSGGGGDTVTGFGAAGIGQTIPVTGDFDGDGVTDVAAYLPQQGLFAYRPSHGGPDMVVSFGKPGIGASIPAVGDYDGDGKSDLAVYVPSLGAFIYRPSRGGTDVVIAFGTSGAGQSIPAPGDYDGDGTTDPAVYLPRIGTLAYRPSSGGFDVLTPFGPAGAGASIPAPGDYDGDGKTDVAVYIPAMGSFAIHPSGGSADYFAPFGKSGSGASIPAPGDYDGDGKTDVAVYLPSLGLYAYHSSANGVDIVQQFGVSGTSQTVPANSIPAAQPAPTGGTAASPSVTVAIPTITEILDPTTSTSKKKKT